MIKPAHIIVFRLSAMGDVAMVVPVLKALVEENENVKITVVSRPFLQPLFKDIKNVSFFAANVAKDYKGVLGLWKLFKELNKLKPTHFADLHNVLRSKIVRLFFKLSNCKVKVINKGRKEKKALTRVENKIFKPLKTTHQRYADVFNSLGFSISICNTSKTEYKPQLNKIVTALTGEKIFYWIGIAPFATHIYKEYPLDLMEQIIEQLSEKKYSLFLFGGKQDVKKLEAIACKYPNVIVVASKLGGLKNELNLIANLDVMLSMDSGNAHLAAMQGVKTITLWGSTHPYAGFAPFRQPLDFCITPNLEKYPFLPCSVYGNKTHKGYEKVMRSIPPEKVVKKIISVL